MKESLDHCKYDAVGNRYAGDHMLVELWCAKHLDESDYLCEAVEAAARAAGATILHSHYHAFGEGGGVSGVTILAESHITIHTWPEIEFMAADIFMCGDCDPRDCLPVLEKYLQPTEITTQCILRGWRSGTASPQRVA